VLVAQRNRKNVKVFKQASDADCFVKSHVLFTHREITSQRDDSSIIAVLRLKQEIIQNMFKCRHDKKIGLTLILRTGSSSWVAGKYFTRCSRLMLPAQYLLLKPSTLRVKSSNTVVTNNVED